MGKKVISVENVSKVYRLGEIGTGTLSSDVNRWWVTKVLGKEDPYLKIGQVNDRATKGENDIVYSLKDVSFEVEQGEVLGIIGKNGAGKSTLLKILSRITSPTTGRVRMKGRVASLLEVGTGFHPELTGRENIFLNGSILGMRKHEISRKLDEIIDFSGVERYIDTPVKRYSSGMYVRLAFAVAAHLESEILIVDEVLAVGDAEFQKKCLGRMKDVSLNEGRTVLFVSHIMASISELCLNGLLLDSGIVKKTGAVFDCLDVYSNINSLVDSYCCDVVNSELPQITKSHVSVNDKELLICISINSELVLKNVVVGVVVKDIMGVPVFGLNNLMMKGGYVISDIKSCTVQLKIQDLCIRSGRYSVSLYLGDGVYDSIALDSIMQFVFYNDAIDDSRTPNIKYIGSYIPEKTEWTFYDE